MSDTSRERAAYMALLELPHGGVRLRLQGAMCELRDHIAAAEGREPQDVQDECELDAHLLSLGWERHSDLEYRRPTVGGWEYATANQIARAL